MSRLRAAWKGLGAEHRAVLIAALVLLATMFLPWYSKSVDAVVAGRLDSQSSAKLAVTVFSLVEAAIFLVSVAVVVLVLARGERRSFDLPGGDGTVVTAAGAWVTFLVFYRFIDKPSGGGGGTLRVEYGLSWGIFFGLMAALALLASGLHLRAAHLGEPPRRGDAAPGSGPRGDAAPPSGPAASAGPTAAERRAEREARRAARERPGPGASPTVVQARERPGPGASPTVVQARGAPGAPPSPRALPGPAADAPVRQERPPRPQAPTTPDPPQLPFE